MTILQVVAIALAMNGMIDMGVKHSDMYPDTKPADDSGANAVCYPSLSVSGKFAEKMGADDLEVGDEVKVPVVFKVTRKTSSDDGEGKEVCLSLDVLKMGDTMVDAKDDNDPDAEDDASMEDDLPPGALAALRDES